ncbi:hypothetical protein ASG81_21820 [Paenibacillus sp. Soil522]|nr:hypothetical protein ASG81_21820 [Paenibacillus sp. Soil522]
MRNETSKDRNLQRGIPVLVGEYPEMVKGDRDEYELFNTTRWPKYRVLQLLGRAYVRSGLRYRRQIVHQEEENSHGLADGLQ